MSLFDDGWTVERPSVLPPYAQIERRLEALIESGALQPGDRLPSERELAMRVGVSRLTARAALASLAQRGLLERGVGRRGTFVARPRLTYDLRDFAGFTEMARRQGLAPGAEVLHVRERSAPEGVARELALAAAAPVYEIVRLRSAGGEPLTLEETWIPAEPFPEFLNHDLTASLYDVMHNEYERGPVRAVERLQATAAGEREARALGVGPGTALMLVVRVAYAKDETPVEFARDHHRGDRAHFIAELTTRLRRD
jgi:GntR family transcriptional regulator